MLSIGNLAPRAALLSATVGLLACSAGGAPENQYDVEASNDDRQKTAENGQPSKAMAAESGKTSSYTDGIMLQQAETACKSGDFKSFFEAALRSRPVRTHYFTSPIKTGSGLQSGKNYSFPFEMMDTYFVTTDSVTRERDDRENVVLDINQASDNRVRVDWVRIDYGPGGNDPGADDGGAQLADDKEYGPRGYLLFYPTDACWALIEDGIEK